LAVVVVGGDEEESEDEEAVNESEGKGEGEEERVFRREAAQTRKSCRSSSIDGADEVSASIV